MSLKLFKFQFRALGSANDMQFYWHDQDQASSISESVINEIKLIESKYSRYLPESIVSKINAASGLESIEVDQETAALLDYAQVCYQESDQLFDLTSGVLRKAWNFKNNLLPSQDNIMALLPLVGWNNVEWHKPLFKLKIKGMEIDFGGIGKEFASDRACQKLQKHGVKHGLVNLGGDIRIIGAQPNDKAWNIGITHPRINGTLIASLQIKNGAIATSGDYERFIEVDGVRYSHLLNPKSGWPVKNSFQCVTIISESCLVSGSISTIAMLMGERAGLRYLEDLKVPYLVVNSNGGIINCSY